jgi:lysophospholipase L1-like esterase
MKINILNNKYILAISAAFILNACTYTAPEPAENPFEVANTSAGSLDLSKYVAVGNSLTAGYLDGALFDYGQKNSFPAILAKQFALVNGNQPFNQPDISSVNGFFQVHPLNNAIALGRLRLQMPTDGCEKKSMAPGPTLGDFPGAFTGNKAALNNFGVPGILLGQALHPGTGTPGHAFFNPLYGRFASAPGTSTIMGDALAAQPTFFTLGLGNNDVLGYATSGGTRPEIFTSPEAFQQMYPMALGALVTSSKQPKGVVMTIPDVTSIPFFKAVTANIRPFSLDPTTAANLNGLYQAYGLGNPGFQAGNVNYFTIVTGNGTVRQFKPGKDLMTMTAPTNDFGFGPFDPCDPSKQRKGMGIAKGLGTATPEPFPIPNQFILDEDEVAAVQARTIAFNNIIKATAASINQGGKKVAVYDVYEFFKKVDSEGIFYGGVKITPALPFGNFISLDGVHPTARGYAVSANEIIKLLNTEFGAKLPLVNPMDYQGNPLPQ